MDEGVHSAVHSDEKLVIMKAIRVSFLDPEKELCVFPDASTEHWGLFISQIPSEDLKLPFRQQRHEPLACMSGTFKNSQERWHIKEKEAYPILVAAQKLRHMLRRSKGFYLFTDHRNLVYLFDPKSRKNLMKSADDRVSRWTFILMGYNYQVEHIPGEDNVVADLLSRWGAPMKTVRVNQISFRPGLVNVLQSSDFQWPTLEEIASEQLKNSASTPKIPGLVSKLMKRPGKQFKLVVNRRQRVWVPTEDLKVHICVIAHAGINGHRKTQATLRSIKSKFFWSDMINDVQKFCRQCLHCRVDGSDIIPRPLGSAIHAKKPREVLHYDFMHVGPATGNFGAQLQYILVLKDDFSGYTVLFPCQFADSTAAVHALLIWYSRFGEPEVHVTDGASHFKNEVIAELNRVTQTKHHFTHAYVPHANGTVERVNRELRRLIRVWNSEFQITLEKWPTLVPLLQYVINFSESSIHGETPAWIFGGFKSKKPLHVIFDDSVKEWRSSPLSAAEIRQTSEKLREELNLIHKDINSNPKSRRGKTQRSKTRKMPVKLNAHVGDYVMYATRHIGAQKRSKPKWTGPYRVTRVESEWDFEIEHLVTGKRRQAHACRLDFYSDKSLHVDTKLKDQIVHDESRVTYRVESILKHARQADGWKLLVQWQGFDAEDATWEPIQQMLEDVPVIVERYVHALEDRAVRAELQSAISFRGRS